MWEEDWYILMPIEYKLFWNWIILKCDHAGFFKPNKLSFESSNKVQVDLNIALSHFNQDRSQIRVLSSGTWFIEDFILFQYGGTLNEANRVHLSILRLLGQNGVNLESIRGQLDHKEGVKDKDKDKDKYSKKRSKEGKQEIELTEEEKTRDGKLRDFISAECQNLLKFKEPLTIRQFIKLKEQFDGLEIETTMKSLANKVGAEKSYISVYKTLLNWLKLNRERKLQPTG